MHHPHDKFFKRNLKEKKIAIDFLKAYLPPVIYQSIALDTLRLTEKSFVIPTLREIHSDIIYQCKINQKPGYLFFLVEHESTAKNEFMAFRLLQYIVSLSAEHLQQGHKKLPIILPLCVYHGEVSPYPHATDLYDHFDDPDFARQVAFKPFKLIDLTILSDEEISQHGLAALMEMLFKHHRAKNFMSIMRKMLQNQLLQNVVKQLPISYLRDMLSYIVNTTQDEHEPQATHHLIKELIQAFPEESARKSIMTFAQQFKEEYKQEFMSTLAPQIRQEGRQEGRLEGRQEGRQEGRLEGRQEGLLEGAQDKAQVIAKKMLNTGKDWNDIKELTGLSDQALRGLEKECLANESSFGRGVA